MLPARDRSSLQPSRLARNTQLTRPTCPREFETGCSQGANLRASICLARCSAKLTPKLERPPSSSSHLEVARGERFRPRGRSLAKAGRPDADGLAAYFALLPPLSRRLQMAGKRQLPWPQHKGAPAIELAMGSFVLPWPQLACSARRFEWNSNQTHANSPPTCLPVRSSQTIRRQFVQRAATPTPPLD